ncbi:hypothetical protein [Pectobacterium wasabiae]|uniref:Uncharacterized protein n=1 Tax=Pectobacterium wasabiae TaxID=55208 RepID=A0AAW3EPP8_9GAMM|nr:hypothetical protein [Pectobacterium wasabiae]AOR64261.1 hypothetical protein A7983_13555 [Pectobacterium wasabiae CFBP 3304]EJS92352.1 Hypothetical protein Y17_4188 [Pectobacterium wasabiae CFBP 3304]KFX09252.1 hypothetical protein JV38_06035 [Pectobacterium wasabiae]KGA29359.1 hypothetical protein KU73_09755 [Pectobacterium wasabiae]
MQKILFGTTREGLEITTYQTTNLEFDYLNKKYRIEIYIKQRNDAEKIKEALKEGKVFTPEKKEVIYKIKNIELVVKSPFSKIKTSADRESVFNFDGVNYSAIICAFSVEEELKRLKEIEKENEDW